MLLALPSRTRSASSDSRAAESARGSRRGALAPRRSAGCRALVAASLALALAGCADRSGGGDGPTPPDGPGEWRLYGGSIARTFFNPHETTITKESARRLVRLWRFRTNAIITASPIVAKVVLPGEGEVQVLYVPSWDGTFYALRTVDGSLVWSHRFKPHPGASYPQAGSAAVEDIDGRRTVFVASGMTMHALDAASGAVIWEFDAGTGCTDCDSRTERNEVESSPAVFDGAVYFGMDVNDSIGKGGFYAVDARRGTLRWFFDLETGAACHPDPGDDVRRFDGYHSEAELGLPPGFFATRRGCDFDRTPTQCGNVWSSATIDPKRRLLYTASSNCDTDENPNTPAPPPPMPPYDEAFFALDVDTGQPAFRWRPREVDPNDLSFGAVPNLFTAQIGGVEREVVGIGNKDGTYTVLDRDGTNEITGVMAEPYWQTQTVAGGSLGGIIASAAVGEGKVLFGTAVGLDLAMPQRPTAWALEQGTGRVIWSDAEGTPGFSPASAIPGVAFVGTIAGSVTVYDSDTGEVLARLAAGGPVASPAVVVDGRVFFGGGTGERGGDPTRIAYQASLVSTPVSAYCVAGVAGCPETGSCDDGNTCTSDSGSGTACSNLPIPDGSTCTAGDRAGHCTGGVCFADEPICPEAGQCRTVSVVDGRCVYDRKLDGTPCTVRGEAASCRSGSCVPSDD